MKKLTQVLTILLMTTLSFSSCKKDDEKNFNCVAGSCVEDTNGSYPTLTACQTTCAGNTSGYNCVTGNCESVNSNAEYTTLTDCQTACAENTSGYNCVSGNCESVNSNADYTTLSACQTACGGNTSGCDGTTTFTDPRDGQTYAIVQIGEQCWFAENLRYSGSISQVSEQANWAAIWNGGNPTEQAAWCYYDNNTANDEIYGKLYNWYAVNSESLCPDGWHIPSQVDWVELIEFLGGVNIAGGKMKTTTGWTAPNTDATNESGFSGLPGGYRDNNGTFDFVGDLGRWWSSNEMNIDAASNYGLNYGVGSAGNYGELKTGGLSCRCLRD